MHRALAAAFAIAGLSAEGGVAMELVFVECGPPLPCGCAPVWIEGCCEPADGGLPTARPKPRRLPAKPAPPDGEAASQPEHATPAPEATGPLTPPPRTTPPPSTEEDAAAPTAPRYTAPPATPETEPSAPPAPSRYEDLFPSEPATDEADSTAPPQPSAETASPDSPPPPTPDAADPGQRQPEPSTSPEYEDIFPPSGALLEPGGWSSDSTRQWTDHAGRALLRGRVSSATAEHVSLRSSAGVVQQVPYGRLSDADLRFLRRQVDARRRQLERTPSQRLAKTGS
jgi:hypothetical protein